MGNRIFLFFLSVFFLGIYAYQGILQGDVRYRVPAFVLRILIAYLLTTLVVALILLSLDKLPLQANPVIALRRLIVVSMPASMGGIIVDGFDKE